jgi:hypothetical protein
MARSRKKQGDLPVWNSLADALKAFAGCRQKTQSQKHIRRLHWYTACRLVIEGGFRPETITPRPPFRIREKASQHFLEYDPSVAVPGEHTIFGGLKTKDVDVVVSLPRVGPVIAVSMKGTLNAFRNLTNRMEEAAGDCTNIHLAYPGLVYAFWHIFRANVEGAAPSDTPRLFELPGGEFKASDVAVRRDGSLSNFLARYFFAMDRLNGRKDMRDDPSSYEAVGITMVNVSDVCSGGILEDHPAGNSPLRHDRMFETVYRQYDLRFVYQSPALKDITRRLSWHDESPALSHLKGMDFLPRVGDTEGDEEESETMEGETEEDG